VLQSPGSAPSKKKKKKKKKKKSRKALRLTQPPIQWVTGEA
jgi:hypothetical protein